MLNGTDDPKILENMQNLKMGSKREAELERRNQELENENKQLKEVAMMIDNMINFASNNDVLLKRKKDLQKKKNNLRIEI